MKALVEEVNPVQRRIKVELSESDVNTAFDSAYRNLRKKARIRGFRPGKAPLQVLRKFYGQSVALDVADQLVRDHLFSAIEQESLQPVASPVLETSQLPQENNGYSFSALIDILPEVKVEGYHDLKLSYQAMSVDEGAVDRELEMLQRRQGKTKEVEPETAAGPSHVATITQKAQLDGQDFAPFNFEKMPVELGKNFILPEMEAAILGLKVGEENDFIAKVPEYYGDKALVGKEVSCQLKLEGLQEMILPELNDELAKDLGIDSLSALRDNIRQGLKQQAEQHRRNQLESGMLQQLSEKNQFEVPPSMVDQVIDSMFEEMEFSSDKEKEAAKKDEERRKPLRETAKQRARNTLILSEVIKSEKIEVTEDDMNQYVKDMISGVGQEEPDEKLLASIKQSLGQQAKESLLFRKAIDFILDKAEVTEILAPNP